MVGQSLMPKKKENRFTNYLKGIFGKSKGEIIFSVLNYLLFAILIVVCVFPFIYVLIKSLKMTDFSSGSPVTKYGFDTYIMVLQDPDMFSSFILSIIVTVVSTFTSLVITILGSYPLIRKDLKGRNLILLFVIFAMLFSGGLIPFYCMIQDLALDNTILIYFVIGLVSPYNIIIVKNFFASLPQEIFESARVDGANEFKTLIKIALPLSGPIIATIALWTAVGKWNDWMTSMYYMSTQPRSTWMFQYLLQNVIAEATPQQGAGNADLILRAEEIKSATIVLSILPIIIVYPFVQKYFVKGVLLGSVKG